MSTYRRSGSSGNRRRRSNRRGRPRYDRIVGAAAVFIVFMIIFVSCCNSCGNDKKPKESKTYETSSQSENAGNGENNTNSGSDDSSLAGLENFSTVSKMPNDVYSGDLILVNKQFEYSFPSGSSSSSSENSENADGEENSEEQSGETSFGGDIVPVYSEMSDSYQVCDYETYLSSKTITAINSMMDKFYENTGLSDTMIIGGYRTKEYQDEKFNSGSSDIKGGCSEFHTGLSFDLGIFPEGESSYYYTSDGNYSWIAENCANYGFVIRYPEGKEDLTGMDSKSYQFRYVGIPHATYMYQNGMCFEEYIEFIKNYTYDTEHLTVAAGEKTYEVYYVPADASANTDVPVPSNKTYEISGNNVDGFIVTVTLS